MPEIGGEAYNIMITEFSNMHIIWYWSYNWDNSSWVNTMLYLAVDQYTESGYDKIYVEELIVFQYIEIISQEKILTTSHLIIAISTFLNAIAAVSGTNAYVIPTEKPYRTAVNCRNNTIVLLLASYLCYFRKHYWAYHSWSHHCHQNIPGPQYIGRRRRHIHHWSTETGQKSML